MLTRSMEVALQGRQLRTCICYGTQVQVTTFMAVTFMAVTLIAVTLMAVTLILI